MKKIILSALGAGALVAALLLTTGAGPVFPPWSPAWVSNMSYQVVMAYGGYPTSGATPTVVTGIVIAVGGTISTNYANTKIASDGGKGTNPAFAGTVEFSGRGHFWNATSNSFVTGGNDTATGFWNTTLGSSSLSNLVDGTRNTAIGFDVLHSLISGSRNFGMGSFAMAFLTNGDWNIGIGSDAFYNMQWGSNNIGMGFAVGYDMVSGVGNTFIGDRAGYGNTNGNFNISIGFGAGRKIAGDHQLIIDSYARATGEEATRTNAIIWGLMATDPANQRLSLNALVGIGKTNPATALDVRGDITATGTNTAGQFVGGGIGLTGVPHQTGDNTTNLTIFEPDTGYYFGWIPGQNGDWIMTGAGGTGLTFNGGGLQFDFALAPTWQSTNEAASKYYVDQAVAGVEGGSVTNAPGGGSEVSWRSNTNGNFASDPAFWYDPTNRTLHVDVLVAGTNTVDQLIINTLNVLSNALLTNVTIVASPSGEFTNILLRGQFTGVLDNTNLPATLSAGTTGNAATATAATGANNSTNFWGVLNDTNLPTTISKSTSGNANGATNFWGVLNDTNLPAIITKNVSTAQPTNVVLTSVANGLAAYTRGITHTNYTAVIASDQVLFCTGTNQVITMPTPTNNTGKYFIFVVSTTTGSIIVTNTSATGYTVKGSTTGITVGATNTVGLISDGANWW